MPARLGDDVDDFCIKCKRLTNHVVVSLMNDGPAKVRCRTCHSDHDYRNEQAPPPKVDPRKLLKDLAKSAAANSGNGVAVGPAGDGVANNDIAGIPAGHAESDEVLIPVDLAAEILAASPEEAREPVGAQAGTGAGKTPATKAKAKKAQH